MIRIQFKDDGDSRTLIVQGHGPGPKGADIFCAGASALVIALEKNLADREIPHETKAGNGYYECTSSHRDSKAHFNHCFQGFLGLDELYGGQYDVTTI